MKNNYPLKITALYGQLAIDKKNALAESCGYTRTDTLTRALKNPKKLSSEKLQIIAAVLNEEFTPSGTPAVSLDYLLMPVIDQTPQPCI
jgi:hypothetical protein